MNTNAQHTPGPWQVHFSHVYTADPERALIAQVLNPGSKESHYPIVANARLIATAPELLAALRELERLAAPHFTSPNGECPGLTLGERAILGARAAIAKAEGKANP